MSLCGAKARVTYGAGQLDPLGEVEPPGPGPWRRLHDSKRGAAGVFDRVGRVRVAWSERVWPDTGRKSQTSARLPGRSTRPISARPAAGSAQWSLDRC